MPSIISMSDHLDVEVALLVVFVGGGDRLRRLDPGDFQGLETLAVLIYRAGSRVERGASGSAMALEASKRPKRAMTRSWRTKRSGPQLTVIYARSCSNLSAGRLHEKLNQSIKPGLTVRTSSRPPRQ